MNGALGMTSRAAAAEPEPPVVRLLHARGVRRYAPGAQTIAQACCLADPRSVSG